MNLEQKVIELEKRVAELEKATAATVTSESLAVEVLKKVNRSIREYTTTVIGVSDIPKGDLNNMNAEPIKNIFSKEAD